MKPRATEPSSFAGKGADAHTASWGTGLLPMPMANGLPGDHSLHPSASQPTGLSLDRLDVVCWVQANLSVVQASLAPALLILILYLGQLIPCRTKRAGLGEPAGDTLTPRSESPPCLSPLTRPTGSGRVSNLDGRDEQSPGGKVAQGPAYFSTKWCVKLHSQGPLRALRRHLSHSDPEASRSDATRLPATSKLKAAFSPMPS